MMQILYTALHNRCCVCIVIISCSDLQPDLDGQDGYLEHCIAPHPVRACLLAVPVPGQRSANRKQGGGWRHGCKGVKEPVCTWPGARLWQCGVAWDAALPQAPGGGQRAG